MKELGSYDMLGIREKDEKESAKLEQQYFDAYQGAGRQKSDAEAEKLDPEIWDAYEKARYNEVCKNELRQKYMKMYSDILGKKLAIIAENRRMVDSLRIKQEKLLERPKRDTFDLIDRQLEKITQKYTFQVPLIRRSVTGKELDDVWKEDGTGIVTTNADGIVKCRNLLMDVKVKIHKCITLRELKEILNALDSELNSISLIPVECTVNRFDVERLDVTKPTETAVICDNRIIKPEPPKSKPVGWVL